MSSVACRVWSVNDGWCLLSCADDRSAEVKKLTDVLTRLFNEPHLKVLSVFIDALIDVVTTHPAQLHDWLPVMLPRLLTKSGSDSVVSLHSKMMHALSVIRSHYHISCC